MALSDVDAVALLVAAGRGERLGAEGPKAFVRVGGRPMVEWSIDALRAVDDIVEVVCALPPGVMAPHGTVGVTGGAERSHSVRAALHAAPDHAEVIVVHDAARPLVSPQVVQDCLDALASEDCDAVIAAVPVTDTIKQAQAREVVRTLDRRDLWAVQTPQVFHRAALERALEADDEQLAAATDDASLIEAFGGTVHLVPSPAENFKVTTPHDLRVADLLLRGR